MHHKFDFGTEGFEQYFLRVMAGEGNRWLDVAMRDILFLSSRCYRTCVQFRNWLFAKRVLKPHELGCLVVSIGNLSCGGTGKTPVVEVFAKTLSAHGRHVAILSRGYRSKRLPLMYKIKALLNNKKMEVPPKVVSDGHNLILNSELAGDEPYMLASNLPDVAVLVDKDRVKAGLHAVREFNSDVIILDDGFQYRKLQPHINIMLVDSTNPFGNGYVLPRGTLREPIKNMRRADYIFLTKSDGSYRIEHLKRFISKHTTRAEIIECCHRPKYLERLFSHDRLPLDYLAGKKVACLSAIACPESFEGFIRGFGAELVICDHFADHHRYTQQEIIDFVNLAKRHGADLIVTTEKDSVRIPLLERCDVPMYFLRIEIDILSGKENFDQCISRICFFKDRSEGK
ncbi:MAG: tetraacyldisaccharide 4'-kinase [Victivallaceae bacterium]|nr:tetraacyldisaccharide 4'-kinase [Victivallaceae bacterium]